MICEAKLSEARRRLWKQVGRSLPVLVLGGITGCATGPDTGTPALTPWQVAELQARAQPAATLGIRVDPVPGGLRVLNANTVAADAPVTVPLVRLPAEGNDPTAVHRFPVVLAVVNGRAGIRVILDSGSNRNLTGFSLAQSCRIPLIAGLSSLRASGIGGVVDNYPAVVPVLRLGGLELLRVFTLVGPDEALWKLPRRWGQKSRLFLLGLNTLRALGAVTIDYRRGAVTFWPRGADQPAATAVAVPLRWESDLPVVEVKLDDRLTVPAVLDTGGDYGIILPRTKAAELGYWKPGREQLATSHGVGGVALAARYSVRQVRVGPATLADVPGRTELLGPEPAGGQVLIGNAVLRRYRVTFDFQNDQLWLE